MLQPTGRREFLANCAKALGGAAMVGALPGAIFAVRRPQAALRDEYMWSMGTQVRLSISAETYAPHTIETAFSAIRTVDNDLTVHRSSSELNRLNADPGSWRSASRPLLEVGRAAREFGDLTEGALDVTVLPILRRLGFAPRYATGGGPETEVVDYTRLHVRGGEVLLEPGGYAVDFGGIAKGFAVDEALGTLEAVGVSAALLDAGGDLYAKGRPESGRPWRIGIRDPFRPDGLFATLEVEDEAVATSGTYAQNRQVDGVTRSHIIDPKTGRSVTSTVSATVVSRSTMASDALATAISVMHPAQGRELIATLPETEAVWVFADGRIVMTDGLKKRLQIL